MPLNLNLSDKESTGSSSGHNNNNRKKKTMVKYRCPGCSEVMIREKELSENEVESDEAAAMTTRRPGMFLEFLPPAPSLQQPPPPPTAEIPNYFPCVNLCTHPNCRRQRIPVFAEKDLIADDFAVAAPAQPAGSKRTREYFYLFNQPLLPIDDYYDPNRTKDFLSLFDGGNNSTNSSTARGRDALNLTISDNAFDKLTLNDPSECP